MTKYIEIPLGGKYGRGKVTLVDEDFAYLEGTLLLAVCGYAVTRQGQYVHRLVMGAGKGQEVDHKNRNALDNRRDNLRFCTRAQNRWNSYQNNSRRSKYKGIWYEKRRNRWIAELKKEGQKVYLGSFLTAEEAARGYDEGARRLHGEFALTNKDLGLL